MRATPGPAPPHSVSVTLQARRWANLRRLLAELEADGIESTLLIQQVLGLRAGVLAKLHKGAEISDAMARELEWAMHRPGGWLDRGPNEPDV